MELPPTDSLTHFVMFVMLAIISMLFSLVMVLLRNAIKELVANVKENTAELKAFRLEFDKHLITDAGNHATVVADVKANTEEIAALRKWRHDVAAWNALGRGGKRPE